MKLICFPHAGGISSFYRFLQNASLSNVDAVYLYDYPGRATNFRQKPFLDFRQCVASITESLNQQIDANDYVLFGHSMGAFVAYEVGLQLQNRHQKPPRMVFISGQKAPCIVNPENYNMDDEKGLDYLIRLGGLPEALLKSRDGLEYFLPITMQDISLLRTYQPSMPSPENRLPQGTVLYGDRDIEVNPSELHLWSEHFHILHGMIRFQGNHFYINKYKDEVIHAMNRILASLGGPLTEMKAN